MRRVGSMSLLLLLLASTVRAQPTEVQLVREWIESVRAHQPGKIDPPLLQVATRRPKDLDLIRRKLKPILQELYPRVDLRNDILRRGAMLHTDIAVLLPEQAAEFTQADVTPQIDVRSSRPAIRYQPDTTVFSVDGEMVATSKDSAHWWMASELLKGVLPHAGSDPFVARWHRAVIAHFESTQLFGSANYAVLRAFEVLPDDPWVLFYAGVVHEVNASPAVQSVPMADAPKSLKWTPPVEEWQRADAFFRRSIAAAGPIEAEVRLGRVLGSLGRHEEAAAVLRAVVPRLTDPRLQYLGYLFLGSEEGELGRVADARAALNRAASLFPSAQSPLVALSEACWRNGDRAGALEALTRLQRLPEDSRERSDPWWHYFDSFAADADQQLEAVRASVGKEPKQ